MAQAVQGVHLRAGDRGRHAFGIGKRHFLIVAGVQQQAWTIDGGQKIAAGKIGNLALGQSLEPALESAEGRRRQALIIAKAPGDIGETVWYRDEHVGLKRDRVRQGMPAFASNQDRQTTNRMADGEADGP